MKWRLGIDKYYIESDMGYKIAKVFMGADCRYEAWRPDLRTAWPKSKFLGSFLTADAAKKACEDFA